jgi:TusA-related sulfurtransferase
MNVPVQADDVLDTVGLYCPVPIIKTAERIRKMEAGRVLTVVSDDRVILIDMPAWCRSTGHEYLGHTQQGTEYRLFVRKATGKEARR